MPRQRRVVPSQVEIGRNHIKTHQIPLDLVPAGLVSCDDAKSLEIRPFDGSRDMTDRWLSVEEIAEYLGVSKDTVYAWISKRNMPAHRIGRLWKFKSEEVDEWVRSGGAAENDGRERG
jgi:excisionase family DNA binding protein